MATGRVVGGHYLNGTVSTFVGSTLVVQSGLKRRKLNADQVTSWEEVPTDSKGNPVSAVGKAVAGAALPGSLGKAASAAVGATFDVLGQSHVVRIDWIDGKQSLIKLPDGLFKHLEVMLQSQRVETAPVSSPAPAPPEKPTVSEQAFSLVSGLVKDRFPTATPATPSPSESAPAAEPDVTEQIRKLASLRDAGIITEDEFAAKKAELLARM